MSAPRGMLIPEMSGRASSPVLVGRAEQMAALEAAFVSVRQGGPSAVLLGGEAGVGKSRLVSDFSRTAASAGARVLTGGKAPNRPGYFVPPTVLSEVAPDEHILTEEIFGPIAPIVTFRDVDQAIEYANKTDRGLAAYVYTRDLAKGLRVAEAIESGMVGLNRGFISDPAAPFGGVKQSGVGREGSHEGLLEFLETKYIATNW